MKRFKSLVLSGFMVLSSAASAFAIDVHVNNQPITMDVPPVIVEGRTLVPIAAISQALNGEVSWSPETKTVTIVRGMSTIMLQLQNQNAVLNGQSVLLEVPAQAIEGRTMIPVGFIAQAFGENVEWDAATRTVLINSEAPDTPIVTPPVVPPVPPVVISPEPPVVVPATPLTVDYIDATKNGVWIKGHRESLIYHVPGGGSYNRISPENIVWFETAADAEAAGYERAEN